MLRISFPTSCQMRTFCAVRKSRVRTAWTPAWPALSFVPLRRIHIAKGTRGHGKIKKKKKKQPSTRAELQSSLHHGDSFLHLVNFRNEERDKNRTLLIRTRKSFEQLNCRLDFFLLSNIHRDRSRKIAIRLKIFLNLIFNEYYRVLRKKLENVLYFN